MAMVWGQGELFAVANKEEIARTKFLLEKYIDMVSLIQDFEIYEKELQQVGIDGEVARRIDQEDLYADKSSNAVLLMEKQRWVYKEYVFYTMTLKRAIGIIRTPEARKAIEFRYIHGLSRGEAISKIKSDGYSDSTVDRRVEKGIEAIANTLKTWGFFERENV
ncbi:hypothetical protein [Paenibacillus agilis]|uniref:Uncharacterized protein n=1 Tax=Paenibacillus agilis TaxID=3020863 RepID=A0A559IZH7_9BACL|nr:hypothetical protein [Paenibacillus agilis]TVX93031.1 hypothetical protein FPZ44_08150 [Paenibacillus agilis]